jgi:transposase
MAAFCRRHSYRCGKSAAELLDRLRRAPSAALVLPPDTLTALISTQVQLLRTLQQTIGEPRQVLADRVQAYPRSELLSALPGVGTVNLAQILAEVGPILDRVDNAEQAAAECGAAPVTKASGKTNGVYFRWAANTRARKAMTYFAHNSRLRVTLGRTALHRRASQRQAEPARHSHRRPRLAARHLGLLAHRHPLPPGSTRGRKTPRRRGS